MNDRQSESNLMPSIKPDQDEVAAFQNSRRSEAPKQSNFNGMLVFVIVLMAIIMGVGGFVLYEVQLKLEEANQLLAEGQKADKDLADNIAATGTGVDRTLQVLKGKIDVNESEIRKLWDVSNKRNRRWIKDNEKNVKAVQTRLAEVSLSNEQMSSTVSTIQSEFVRLNTDMTEVQQLVQDDSEEMTTQVEIVRGQVQDTAVEVGGNKRLIAALQKKVDKAEDDIAAIDQYRLQVNKQILELRRMLQETVDAPTVTSAQ